MKLSSTRYQPHIVEGTNIHSKYAQHTHLCTPEKYPDSIYSTNRKESGSWAKMFIFAKELLFIVVYVTMDIIWNYQTPIWILAQTTTNKREGRSKLIGKNRQSVISFTLTNTTCWNIRLNQLSRREVSADDAIGCTRLNSWWGPGKGCTIFAGAHEHLWMQII